MAYRSQLIIILALLVLLIPTGIGVWTTEAQVTTDDPILLVVNNNPPYQFGRYLGEILRAEGISSFATVEIGTLTAADLAGRDLVILAETSLTPGQAALINNYYSSGGRMLAMRPDPQIAGLFGLGSAVGIQDRAYLRIINNALVNGEAPGLGITDQTIQYHGTATLYNTLAGVVTLAQLYSNVTTPLSFPAVVSTSDGTAAAFAYDLARSIVLMRQGNPANANVDVDNDGVFRTRDLYLSADGNHWVDRTRLPIAQADEQQRLFARLVRQAVESARPLPRLWYFPGTARTLIIATSDSHANPVSYHEELQNAVSDYGGTLTTYLPTTAPSNADIQRWRSQGHEFGMHPYLNPNIVEGYYIADNAFSSRYTSPKSRTVRAHDIGWLGWTDAAELGLQYNVKFNLDLFTIGRWLQLPDGSWPHGFMNGSGQPMRMIRQDGVILDYYQQSVSLVDVQLLCQLGDQGRGYENLDNASAAVVSRELIDNSQAGGYSAIAAFFQVDCVASGTTPWVRSTLAYAQSVGAPIWNADRFLEFTETRYATEYRNITWNEVTNTLTFNMSAPTNNFNVSTIIPLNYNGRSLSSVTVDGVPAAYSVQTIKGRDEAFVSVSAGNRSFAAVYDGELGAPTPTLAPTNTPTNTPTNAPATLTPTNAPTATPAAGSGSLTTLFAHDGRYFHGNMFNVTVTNPLQITSFDMNIAAGTTTVSVYYRTGGYAGFEANPAAWTLMGSATVFGAGPNNRTPVPISSPLLQPGTYGFYVTVTPTFDPITSVDMYYTSGGRTVSNADLSIVAGIGVGGLFGDPAACQARNFSNNPCIFLDRTWNGTIYYQTGVIPTAAPSNTPVPSNTPSLTPTDIPTNTPTLAPTDIPTNTPTPTPSNTPVDGAPVGIADQTTVSVAEGQTATNTGSFTDPENQPLIFSASVGTVTAAGSAWSWSYTPDDGPANSQTVTITASDGLNSGQVTFTLSVTSVAPTAIFTNTSGPIVAGQSASLTFTAAADPSAADTVVGFLFSYDCTNDGAFELVSSSSPTFNCPYPTAGAYTARGRIADKDGAFTDYTASVTVNAPPNNPPVVTANLTSVVVNNGALATNAGLYSDPDGDPITLSASVGTVVNNGNGAWSWSFTPTNGAADSQTVTITANDGRGGTGQAQFLLIVNSATPTPTPDPVQPVTITLQVSASTDDVNQDGNSISNTNTLWIGTGQNTTSSYTGLRFANANIPRGARINAAYLQFYSPNGGWISIAFEMAAEAADNSLTFGSSASARPSGRLLTTARVQHTSNVGWTAGNWYAMNDISALVQEVINRPGWQSGNSLSIILRGTGTAYGRKNVGSFNLSPANAPRLVVNYTLGGASGTSAMEIRQIVEATPLPMATLLPTATPLPTATLPPTPPPATATPVPLPPLAVFTPSVTSGETPLSVQFVNASSGDITSYSWSFGDGGTSAEANPSHTYAAPGTYVVTLIVDGPGGQGSAQTTIEVSAPPLPTESPTEPS